MTLRLFLRLNELRKGKQCWDKYLISSVTSFFFFALIFNTSENVQNFSVLDIDFNLFNIDDLICSNSFTVIFHTNTLYTFFRFSRV